MLQRIRTYLIDFIDQLTHRFDHLTNKVRLRVYKVAIGIFFLIVSTYYLSVQFFENPILVKVGDIANFDIRIPHDLAYVQPKETQRQQEKSRRLVLKIFDKDQSVMRTGVDRLKDFFHQVDLLTREQKQGKNLPLAAQLYELKQKVPASIKLDDDSLQNFLIYTRPNLLNLKSIELYVFVMDQSIVSSKKAFENKNENIIIRTINSTEDVPELTRSLNDLHDLESVKGKLYDISREKFPTLPQAKLKAVVGIVENFLRPNLFFNEAETYRRMEEAVKKTEAVKGVLKKGQIIVRYGEPITQDKYEKILILNKYRNSINVSKVIGILLFQIALGSLIVSYFYRYTSLKFSNAKNITIVSILFFAMITIIFIVSRINGIFSSGNIFALYIPIASLTLTLAVLFDEKVSVGAGLFLSVYIFLMSNSEDVASLYLAFITTLLGSYSVSRVKKRTDFLKIGLYISAANIFMILIITLYESYSIHTFFKLSIVGLLNGVGSSILAFGIIPVLESMFDITTNFKLLELTDLSSTLLKMMLFKAPGTYQHSIAVASLAESACQDIGANALLAKVGIYYHDIGKTKRPEFFIENQAPGSKNPHTMLASHESAKIIIEHVNYGVELIEKNRMPKVLKDFITGHHGKTVIKYFYHKALENGSNPQNIRREDFTYPGPNPRSKEAGVAMLADSIEAASRAMERPITVEKITQLVKKIVNGKINDGLLDNCDLTLSDLRKVSDSFISTLSGIFHNRIEYPEDKETRNLELGLQSFAIGKGQKKNRTN